VTGAPPRPPAAASPRLSPGVCAPRTLTLSIWQAPLRQPLCVDLRCQSGGPGGAAVWSPYTRHSAKGLLFSGVCVRPRRAKAAEAEKAENLGQT